MIARFDLVITNAFIRSNNNADDGNEGCLRLKGLQVGVDEVAGV